MTQTPNNKDIKLENAFVMYGDSIKRLKELPDNSVDSIVTDPPYGLSDNKFVADTIAKWINGERDFIPDGKGFMGKAWDSFVPPPAIWDECLRVLKPGGHLLAFFGSRTQDVGALSIRLAGFEIRDSISWVYGSGFPKSMDISKAIDKQAGADRKVVGIKEGTYADIRGNSLDASISTERERLTVNITAPATDEAKQFAGWGTALKPAHEPIVVARKPLSESTVANNVLQWGTGGLNIDASRVGTTDDMKVTKYPAGRAMSPGGGDRNTPEVYIIPNKAGRFPANFILSHTEDCVETGEVTEVKAGTWNTTKGARPFNNEGEDTGYQTTKKNAMDSVPVFRCAEGCPVAELDKQSGDRPSAYNVSLKYGKPNIFNNGNKNAIDYTNAVRDSGGASRFFYVAKASKKDRNEGLDELPKQNKEQLRDLKRNPKPTKLQERWLSEPMQNIHPTVKPTQLMEYLIKLVTPEGGTVLDPFTGSGSTGKAALLNGFKFIGCELTEEYLPIIEGRLSWASANKDKYQADKVAAVTKANKVAQNTRSKATGGSLTALDAAQVALQQIAAKKANKADNQLPLFDEVEE